MKLNILSKRETKRLLEVIEKQWGARLSLDYVFLQGGKGRIYIANREVFSLDLSKLRIDTIGIYFGRIEDGLRLSIEGSQIVGPHATKYVADVQKDWTKGSDMETQLPKGIYIARLGNDFLGCGKSTGTALLNHYPKSRRN